MQIQIEQQAHVTVVSVAGSIDALTADVLTTALTEQVRNGRPWDLDRTRGGLRLLVPQEGAGSMDESGFAKGNADELYRMRDQIRTEAPDLVLVMSADHVYRLDYSDVVQTHLDKGAEVTVVVSGLPPVDRDAAKKNQNAVMLTSQFATNDRPLVVGGNGIGEGNLVGEIRADPRLVKIISTVDNVSTPQGQLATALTVVERVVSGKVGQYGLSAGATSQVPRTAA